MACNKVEGPSNNNTLSAVATIDTQTKTAYTDNGVEFLTKNSPNHWRKICSDSKSQPRYDYSFFDSSLLQELQLVKPDNHDPMGYEVNRKDFT